MKTVALVARPKFAAGKQEAARLLSYLEAKGLSVLMPHHLAETLKRPELGGSLADLKVDFAVTIGGDGTILFAARNLPLGVPIVPINLQSFGFLSECEIEDALTLLDQVLAGDYEVQEILRLATHFQDISLPDATNEVSLFPHKQGRPPVFQIQIEEGSMFQFRGDGLVIATPSGSTGHALSLGGPVIHPLVDVILLVASAPLRNSMLPLVLPDSTTLRVQVRTTSNLVIDGELVHRIPAEASVTIKKSKSPLLILRRQGSFYRRLRGKLLRWS